MNQLMVRSGFLCFTLSCIVFATASSPRIINFSADNTLGSSGVALWGNLATVTVRNLSTVTQTISMVSGGMLDITANNQLGPWVGSCVANCTVSGSKFRLNAQGIVRFLADPPALTGGDILLHGAIQVDEPSGAVLASGMMVMIMNKTTAPTGWIDRSLPIVINGSRPF